MLYLLLMINKIILDREFAITHKPRNRLENESLDEYDGYLSAHLLAYEKLIDTKGMSAVNTADINFDNEISGMLDRHGQFNTTSQIEYALICEACRWYGFFDVLDKQKRINWFHNRKSYWKALLSDIILLPMVFRNEKDVHMILLCASKMNMPTFLTKFNVWMYKKLNGMKGLFLINNAYMVPVEQEIFN